MGAHQDQVPRAAQRLRLGREDVLGLFYPQLSSHRLTNRVIAFAQPTRAVDRTSPLATRRKSAVTRQSPSFYLRNDPRLLAGDSALLTATFGSSRATGYIVCSRALRSRAGDSLST
jgi:hypothetical protein